MQKSFLKKLNEPEHLLQTPVIPPDYKKLREIQANEVLDYGDGLFIFATLPEDLLAKCRPTILNAPTMAHSRLASKNVMGDLGAQRSYDVTFGYKPSRPVFGHTAGPVRYTVDHPKGFKVLSELGESLEKIGSELIGKEFEDQAIKAKKEILKDYLIGETSFTQGVINRSNALNWHYDRGNYANSYSIMLWVIEGSVSGGQLIVPSLNAYVTPMDGGIIMFKGQNLIHGVAPVFKNRPFSERMSVVFYTNENLKKAETIQVELEKSKLREFRKHFKK